MGLDRSVRKYLNKSNGEYTRQTRLTGYGDDTKKNGLRSKDSCKVPPSR